MPTIFVLSDGDDQEHIRRMVDRLIRRRIINEHDGEDLAQEIRAQLYRRQSRFNANRGDRGAFVFRMIRNVAARFVRHLRTPKRNPSRLNHSQRPIKGVRALSVPFVEWDEGQQRDHRKPETLTPQQQAERKVDLDDFLERLPPRHRGLLKRILDGMTVADAARDMQIHRTTAHRRLKELYERFRQTFPDGL